MTVRGQACMEDTQDSAASQSLAACNGHHYHHHQQQQEDQKGQCTYSGSKRSSVSSGSRFQSVLKVTGPEDTVSRSEDSRTAETDDELPLGSEANSLRQDTEAEQGDGFYYSQPPVDKRLLWLRRGELPNSGWTSFNSDASNLTSGSSANSVDWLLQERQVDPEEVLRNLGFGSGPMQDTTTMYTRIPVRFLQQQAQDGAQQDDAEVGGQEGSGEGSRRNPSRGQFWLMPNFNSSCLDNEYYTQILNRVPAYFFHESAMSSASDSGDSDILPLDSVTGVGMDPNSNVFLTATDTSGLEVDGKTSVDAHLTRSPAHDKRIQSPHFKSQQRTVNPFVCAPTGTVHSTGGSKHKGVNGVIVDFSSQNGAVDSRTGPLPIQHPLMRHLLPDDDNLSSSSGSMTTVDDVKYGAYDVHPATNESLV